VRDLWGRSSQAVGLLKELWDIDATVYPVVAIQRVLDVADPNDDRVWLARANLAIKTGWYDEARKRLDACLSRRPDDRAVWRGCLDLALAWDDLPGVWQALPHLPAGEFSMAEVLDLRAWGVAHTGDAEGQRRRPRGLVERHPAKT